MLVAEYIFHSGSADWLANGDALMCLTAILKPGWTTAARADGMGFFWTTQKKYPVKLRVI